MKQLHHIWGTSSRHATFYSIQTTVFLSTFSNFTDLPSVPLVHSRTTLRCIPFETEIMSWFIFTRTCMHVCHMHCTAPWHVSVQWVWPVKILTLNSHRISLHLSFTSENGHCNDNRKMLARCFTRIIWLVWAWSILQAAPKQFSASAGGSPPGSDGDSSKPFNQAASWSKACDLSLLSRVEIRPKTHRESGSPARNPTFSAIKHKTFGYFELPRLVLGISTDKCCTKSGGFRAENRYSALYLCLVETTVIDKSNTQIGTKHVLHGFLYYPRGYIHCKFVLPKVHSQIHVHGRHTINKGSLLANE